MVCIQCSEWFSVLSRTPKLCRDCEGKRIAEAAREIDSRSMPLDSLVSWIVFQRQPLRFRRAWEAK